MKNKIKLVALSILLAFGSVQAQSMDENANKQEYVQGQKSTYLAGYHQNKMGVNCSTCHPTDKVTDSEREIDVSCQSIDP